VGERETMRECGGVLWNFLSRIGRVKRERDGERELKEIAEKPINIMIDDNVKYTISDYRDQL
jgi:hypothetical protein